MNPRVNMASYRPAVTAESGGPSGSHGEFHLQGNLLKTPLSNKKKKKSANNIAFKLHELSNNEIARFVGFSIFLRNFLRHVRRFNGPLKSSFGL